MHSPTGVTAPTSHLDPSYTYCCDDRLQVSVALMLVIRRLHCLQSRKVSLREDVFLEQADPIGSCCFWAQI